jgi:serine/threonine protein phosphatase PrpC
VSEIDVQAGDRLLICSDGLSAVVTSEHVQSILQTAASLDEACDALIAAANAAGGPDNITVTLLRIDVE